MPSTRRMALVGSAISFVLAACSATSNGTEGPTSPMTPPPLAWSPCGKAECSVLVVPRDYEDPAQGTFELAVARRPATRPEARLGVLLFNPGGPGLPGTPVIRAAADLHEGFFSNPATTKLDLVVWDGRPGSPLMRAGFDQFSAALLEHFDIVSWDPRGVSGDSRIDCVDDPDFFRGLDPTPETRAESAALEDRVGEFLAGCLERSANLLPYVGSVTTARDMDLLRAALGEEQISYLGVSYGAALGALYATLYPDRVRAMVLDAGYDLSAPPQGLSLQAAVARERVLGAILDECAADDLCYFHNAGDSHRAFARLMQELDASPLWVEPIRTPVDDLEAWRAVLFALMDEAKWTRLVMALGEAQDGDGMELLLLSEEFGLPVLPAPDAQVAIRCLDWPTRQGFRMGFGPGGEMAVVAPTGVAAAAWPLCELWPVEPRLVPNVTGAGAGPILVLAALGDTVVSFESGRQLAGALENGILVGAEGSRHGSYQPWRSDAECVVTAVDAYLIDLRVPGAGAVCLRDQAAAGEG